jgi:hypothetical protein
MLVLSRMGSWEELTGDGAWKVWSPHTRMVEWSADIGGGGGAGAGGGGGEGELGEGEEELGCVG